MKLVKRDKIGSGIMSLIDAAESKFVIISPYIKFDIWPELIETLKTARNRGVKIFFYVRSGTSDDLSQFRAIGIVPAFITNLHAKVYYNDKRAIVTSMNLSLYSNLKSVEIAYETESKEEYDSLNHFCDSEIIRLARKEIDQYGRTLSDSRQFYFELAEKIEWDFQIVETVPMESYVFCKGLLPNFDVMIDVKGITFKTNKHLSIDLHSTRAVFPWDLSIDFQGKWQYIKCTFHESNETVYELVSHLKESLIFMKSFG